MGSPPAFLQQAARRELGWPDPDAVDAAIARGRVALSGAGRFDSAELIRNDRDEREEDPDSARALLDRRRARRVVLHVLDLTYYELGTALLRGRARATAQ